MLVLINGTKLLSKTISLDNNAVPQGLCVGASQHIHQVSTDGIVLSQNFLNLANLASTTLSSFLPELLAVRRSLLSEEVLMLEGERI